MTSVKRISEQITRHIGPDSDLTLLATRYEVEGVNRVLIMRTYMDDWIALDEELLDQRREDQDIEAQWCADHPDQITPPT